MKKLLLILLCFMYKTSIAQIVTPPPPITISKDSLLNSPNAGAYFIKTLKESITGENLGTSQNKQNIRTLDFWSKRIPTGDSSKNPFLKYAKALQTAIATAIPCPPEPREFNGNWVNNGPVSVNMRQGLVQSIYSPPNNPNTIWIGVAMGGLWKTIDSGDNWTCVSDLFGVIGEFGVNAIAVNPNDTNQMYIGTAIDERNKYGSYGRGVWFSNDAGLTWALDATGLLSDPTDPNLELRHIMEYTPLMVNGNTDPMIWSCQNNAFSQVTFSKKIGTGAWSLQSTPENDTALGGDGFYKGWMDDITFKPTASAGIFGEAIVAFRESEVWNSGKLLFTPAMLYRVVYDASGIINSWQLLHGPNNNKDFGWTSLTNVGNYNTVYAGNNKYYVAMASSNMWPLVWDTNTMSYIQQYDTINKTYLFSANPYSNAGMKGRVSVYELDLNNPATPIWTPISIGIEPDYQSVFTLRIASNPNSNPSTIYLGTNEAHLIQRGALGTWVTTNLYGYNSNPNFHVDVRDVKIQNPNESNPSLQRVFWGHDGGISKGNTFPFKGLNGKGFYTNMVQDVGVSTAGRKRAVASFHNAGQAKLPNGNWIDFGSGDGWDAIYDKRTNHNNQQLIYHGNDSTNKLFEHTNIGLGLPPSGPDWTPPTSVEDKFRHQAYQQDFDVDNDFMYMGNTNMFRSFPGSVDNWQPLTGVISGIGFFNFFPTSGEARSIAVAPSNTEVKYLCLKSAANADNSLFGRMPAGLSYIWKNITPDAVKVWNFLPQKIIVDPLNPARIWLSLGGLSYANPPNSRVLYNSNYGKDSFWVDMSSGLSALPVVSLVYQKGSDDIIYAGTDDGVYRWDKPKGCWVKFNDAIVPNTKMPNVLANDLEIDYCAGKLVMGAYARGIWESDLYKPSSDYGFASGYGTIINQNTIWSSDKYVEGHVLVAGGVTLTIKGVPDYVTKTSSTTIYMMKDGIIDVAHGGKLILDGAKITNGCDEMWYGINLMGQNNFDQIYLPTTGRYQEHAFFEGKGGIIENAREALNNYSPSVSWSTGGVIKADNVHFENCRRSMQFMKFENPTFGKPDESKITNCIFNVNDNILTEFAYHISMWDVHNISVKNCIFNNNQSIQTNHQKGFVSIDAEYSLTNSELNNFVTGVESGAGLNGQNLSLEIKNNLFDGNQFGIDMYSITRGLQVINNEFKIGKLQYGYSGGGGFGYQTMGSNLRCNSNFVYNDNIHSLVYAAPNAVPFIYQHSIGTLINSSGDIEQPIIRNFYTDLLIGNQAIGTCGSNSFIIRGLNYLCNTNTNNNKYDFYLYWNTIVKKNQAANLLKATGNIFSQNATVINWYHHALGANSPVFYYCNQNLAAFNERPNTSSVNVMPVLTTNLPICSQVTNILGNIGNADLANLKTQFATSNNLYTNYLSTYNALIDNGNTALTVNEIEDATLAQQMQLRSELLATSPYLSEEALRSMVNENILTTAMQFEVIMANPDASKSEAFITFLEDEAPSPLPNYMINLIRGSWTGSSTRSLLETNLSTEYSIASSNREQILNYYNNDTLFRNEDSLITWLNKLPSIRDKYQLADYHLNKENYSLAQSTLESIPLQFKLSTQELYDYQSFVNFYNFKKNIIENDISINKLDSTRISNLKDIADIAQSTVARERARGILCFFYNLCYELDEEPEIQTKGKTITRKEEIQKDVEVYPNPAKDYVTFSFINASIACKDCIIKISDLQGRTIYTANLENAKQQHIWDTRKTTSGTYIYEIKSTTKVWSGKIVVVK